jgi:hypothetical protein
MAVPTIPSSISLGNIQTEFGGSNPISISEYYSGGAYVAGGTANATSVVIPTSGTISFSNFSGAAAVVSPVVDLPQYNAGLGYDVNLTASGSPSGLGLSWASAQIILYANGNGVYRESNVNTGDFDTPFTWLTSGSASTAYAYLDTPSGDSVEGTSSAVATSLQMTTTRAWQWYVQTTGSYLSKSATTTLRLKNSAGTDLDTVTVSVLIGATQSGELGGGGGCCFTGDTLVTMADLSTKPIESIQVGDLILSYNPDTQQNETNEVSEIITRVNRVMYEFHLENGTNIRGSQDHPFYVVGKGYCSMNPPMTMNGYKALTDVTFIAVGDKLVDKDRNEILLQNIVPLGLSETVYTFNNKHKTSPNFYANGVLVY